MGQKVNPNGFRLGITQTHLSNWFEDKKNYSNIINEDFIIRNTITHFLKQEQLRFSNIIINRHLENQLVLVYISTLDIKQILDINLEKLEKNLKKVLKKNFKIIPKIIEEEQKDATLIGLKIVECLCNRIPFKRAIKTTLTECREAGVLGIKIQVSGRLNGVEIARSEWRRIGCVPLHTLKAKINYSYQTAQTIYGIIGVKVWLFLGEEQSISKKFV